MMYNQRSVHFILRSTFTHAKLMATAILVMAVSSTSLFAAAQQVCGSRPQLLEQLSKKYSEQPIALGLINNGALVEVLTSESGLTWTIIISQPNGASCLIAAGEGWEELKRVASSERGA